MLAQFVFAIIGSGKQGGETRTPLPTFDYTRHLLPMQTCDEICHSNINLFIMKDLLPRFALAKEEHAWMLGSAGGLGEAPVSRAA